MSAQTLAYLHKVLREGAVDQELSFEPRNPFQDLKGEKQLFTVSLVQRTAAHRVLDRVNDCLEKGEEISPQLREDIRYVIGKANQKAK